MISAEIIGGNSPVGAEQATWSLLHFYPPLTTVDTFLRRLPDNVYFYGDNRTVFVDPAVERLAFIRATHGSSVPTVPDAKGIVLEQRLGLINAESVQVFDGTDLYGIEVQLVAYHPSPVNWYQGRDDYNAQPPETKLRQSIGPLGAWISIFFRDVDNIIDAKTAGISNSRWRTAVNSGLKFAARTLWLPGVGVAACALARVVPDTTPPPPGITEVHTSEGPHFILSPGEAGFEGPELQAWLGAHNVADDCVIQDAAVYDAFADNGGAAVIEGLAGVANEALAQAPPDAVDDFTALTCNVHPDGDVALYFTTATTTQDHVVHVPTLAGSFAPGIINEDGRLTAVIAQAPESEVTPEIGAVPEVVTLTDCPAVMAQDPVLGAMSKEDREATLKALFGAEQQNIKDSLQAQGIDPSQVDLQSLCWVDRSVDPPDGRIAVLVFSNDHKSAWVTQWDDGIFPPRPDHRVGAFHWVEIEAPEGVLEGNFPQGEEVPQILAVDPGKETKAGSLVIARWQQGTWFAPDGTVFVSPTEAPTPPHAEGQVELAAIVPESMVCAKPEWCFNMEPKYPNQMYHDYAAAWVANPAMQKYLRELGVNPSLEGFFAFLPTSYGPDGQPYYLPGQTPRGTPLPFLLGHNIVSGLMKENPAAADGIYYDGLRFLFYSLDQWENNEGGIGDYLKAVYPANTKIKEPPTIGGSTLKQYRVSEFGVVITDDKRLMFVGGNEHVGYNMVQNTGLFGGTGNTFRPDVDTKIATAMWLTYLNFMRVAATTEINTPDTYRYTCIEDPVYCTSGTTYKSIDEAQLVFRPSP